MTSRTPRLAVITAAALVVALLGAGARSSGRAAAAAGDGAAAAATWTVPLSTPPGAAHGLVTAGGLLQLSTAADRPASRHGQPAEGSLDLPVRELAAPANRMATVLDAATPAGSTVGVAVRGRRLDGRWTEWLATRPGAPAVLPEATRSVQLRVVLTARRTAPDQSSGWSARSPTGSASCARCPRCAR